MKLGILTGLAREANCLPPPSADMFIKCAGASPERAGQLTRELVADGCGALLSFGVAGALSPELSVGDVVLATGVINANGNEIPTTEIWRKRVYEVLSENEGIVWQGLIYGSDDAIRLPSGKADCHQKTGALCVDMETHKMARVAAEAQTPFLAIRVISDDANRVVPSAALGVIGADGKPQISRVLSGLIRHPEQIPALVHLAKDMEVAVSQLRRVSRLAGPLFRFF